MLVKDIDKIHHTHTQPIWRHGKSTLLMLCTAGGDYWVETTSTQQPTVHLLSSWQDKFTEWMKEKLYFQKNSLAYPNMVTSGSKIIRRSWPRWKTSGFKMLADEWRHCFTRLFSLYKSFSSLLSFPSSANQPRQITPPYWAWKCFFFPSFANRFLVEVSWSVGAAEEFLLIALWSVTGRLFKLLIASLFSHLLW